MGSVLNRPMWRARLQIFFVLAPELQMEASLVSTNNNKNNNNNNNKIIIIIIIKSKSKSGEYYSVVYTNSVDPIGHVSCRSNQLSRGLELCVGATFELWCGLFRLEVDFAQLLQVVDWQESARETWEVPRTSRVTHN